MKQIYNYKNVNTNFLIFIRLEKIISIKKFRPFPNIIAFYKNIPFVDIKYQFPHAWVKSTNERPLYSIVNENNLANIH